MNRTKLRRMNQAVAVRQVKDDRYISAQNVVYTGKTRAGVRISGDNSLTISSVWACIRFLTQNVAGLPWEVRRPIVNGLHEASEKVTTTPVHWLINQRPSDDWSSFQFRETLLHWALIRGNGYAEIERDVIGRPMAMHPIHPDRVEVFRNETTQRLIYRVDGNIELPPEDVFHLRGFGHGPVGVNVIAYAAESLGWAKAAQMFGASFFGNGATPSGIVTMKKSLDPQGLLELEDRFHRLYGGSNGQNRTVFLDNDMDYQSVTVEPEKGQFIETNQHLVDEICRWFGVPPHKIYQLLHATFSNIEHQSIEVVTDSLQPWAKRFEDEANYKLFGRQNRQSFFTKMIFTSLLRGDTKTRLEYYRGLREIGVLNADEIREAEDMRPIPDGEGGDKRVMQGQYTTLEKIGEQPEGQVAPVPAAPDAPDEPDEAAAPGDGEDEDAAAPAPAVNWERVSAGVVQLNRI